MASFSSLSMNSWEICALQYEFPASPDSEEAAAAWRQLPDPVIYPGIYSATGYDVMSLLLRVISRPDPKIDIGAVDCSVALVVCDISLGDAPITYASDPFCDLTGYSRREVVGRNCRFLQRPPKGRPSAPRPSPHGVHDDGKDGHDKAVLKRIRQAVRNQEEIQTPVANFKKNGDRFTNLLTIIPLDKEPSGHQFAVGFQVQID